jgi:hypothetical protein
MNTDNISEQQHTENSDNHNKRLLQSIATKNNSNWALITTNSSKTNSFLLRKNNTFENFLHT